METGSLDTAAPYHVDIPVSYVISNVTEEHELG
jgi:hypothetical protein